MNYTTSAHAGGQRLALLLALTASAGAWAAGEMKTGLWEMSMLLSDEQMQGLPKDAKLPGLVGNRLVKQACITAREADSLGMLDDRDGGACKLVNKTSAGNTHSAQVVCSGPNQDGAGRWTTVFTDSGNIRSVIEVDVVLQDRKTIQRHETTGRWLRADCGTVR